MQVFLGVLLNCSKQLRYELPENVVSGKFEWNFF